MVAAATGILPALQASRPGLLPGLKDGPARPRRNRLQAVFVGGEIASCVLLVVMTAVMMRSAQKAAAIDPVLPVAHLLIVDAGEELRNTARGPGPRGGADGIARRLEALPGVTATAFADPLPFSGNRFATMVRRIEAPDGPGTRRVRLARHPRRSLRLPTSPSSAAAGSSGAPNEVVINQTLAARLWGQRRTRSGSLSSTVISRASNPRRGWRRPRLAVRLAAAAERTVPVPADRPVRAAGRSWRGRPVRPRPSLRAADSEVRPRRSRREDRGLDGRERPRRRKSRPCRPAPGMIGGLGALALVLALFGVAAVTAHAVAQRTHEIGVRMALGATTTDTTSLMVRQSMRPVIVGLLLGVRWRRARLARGGGVPLRPERDRSHRVRHCRRVPVAASIVAAWIPARRAARVDPLIALRAE